ncbi:hypothetical protein [Aureimonas sp. Leaf324]|jgi:hypothetical protein|nr:hypothetical protein [Aureimonas sp. Leaf324]
MPPIAPRTPSVLRRSALERLAVAFVATLVLWGVVAWAVSA